MEFEQIKIFDEHGHEIGIEGREDVHQKGDWHETFHCWIVGKAGGVDYIYFQIRSEQKKDYPNLLDITAAGHILAHESVIDGIREIKEELGLDVSFSELESLGMIKDCILTNQLIDKEFCHVYLYHLKERIGKLTLQKDEVSGIVKGKFKDFFYLCFGDKEEMMVEGFQINENEKEEAIKKLVGIKDFVPHEDTYLESVVTRINERLR
ncbi:NUDIX hydrolase [Cytobacillus sp. Hz8]|uniref:NUDIX hydrolase n=1 Tax=Cytobacillus sp. Hz8 TaxID=3347168 RepID=UPI0035DB922F